MAKADPKPDALRRLGGGRWETKDGRFQIEPQSGTWVVVDTTQANEFGLPLVRGPYSSLGAAKEAIESARNAGPVTSPLADRIEEAAREPAAPARAVAKGIRGSGPGETGAMADDRAVDEEEPAEAAPPPDPAWVRGLKPPGRQKALALIERLEKLGIEDADAIARAEIADGEPAMARLAITRRLEQAITSKRVPRSAVAAAIEAILAGEDEALEVAWHLVDDRGRRIEKLDVDT